VFLFFPHILSRIRHCPHPHFGTVVGCACRFDGFGRVSVDAFIAWVVFDGLDRLRCFAFSDSSGLGFAWS